MTRIDMALWTGGNLVENGGKGWCQRSVGARNRAHSVCQRSVRPRSVAHHRMRSYSLRSMHAQLNSAVASSFPIPSGPYTAHLAATLPNLRWLSAKLRLTYTVLLVGIGDGNARSLPSLVLRSMLKQRRILMRMH